MLSIIIALSIIMSILIALIVRREYDFARERKLNFALSGDIGSLAINMRRVRADGGCPSVKLIRHRLRRAYNIIRRKIDSGIELYEYEKWLYENFYNVISKIDVINVSQFALLPHIYGRARVLYVAEHILSHSRYALDKDTIVSRINEFNEYTPLEVEEIFALNDAMYIVLANKIAELSMDSREHYRAYLVAQRQRYIRRYTKFDSYLYYRKRLWGKESEENNQAGGNIEFTFSKVLFEHAAIISNCINGINQLEYMINLVTLVGLSVCDRLMRTDTDYRRMDIKSRVSYLMAVSDLSHKYKVDESRIVREAVSLGRENGEHFGGYLFDKKIALKKRVVTKMLWITWTNRDIQRLFIGAVWGCSILLATFASLFGVVNIGVSIMYCLASLVALLPAVQSVVIYISRIFISQRPIFKMDNRTVSKENSTLVIMPSYVGDMEEANRLCDAIVRIREGNKGENISFALLIDYKKADSMTTVEDYDINRLFKSRLSKYADINVYVRKRTKVRDKYIAYERKRGAIMDMLDMLVTKNEQSFSYIMNDKIYETPRFIMTLDSDSELMPESVLNAVNTMLHPLNHKYSLLSYKSSYNLYSAKSLIAKEYYYDSGYDRYGSTESFYYSLSGHAIFNGKGIFRVDKFYSALYNVLPSNRVLSHDIIEGAILSTGELQEAVYEDIPSSIVSDISRRNRWQKGDLMLLPFLKNKIKNDNGAVKKVDKEPIYNFIILQNALKVFESIGLLILFVTGVFYRSIIASLPFIAIFLLPYIVRLSLALYATMQKRRARYVLGDIVGIIAQLIVKFFLLPFYAVNSVLVLSNTIYSVFRQADRLTWRTFASTQDYNTFYAHIRMMTPSLLISAILSVAFIGNVWLVGYFAIAFAMQICLYLASRESTFKDTLYPEDKEFLNKIGEKTYKFFCNCEQNGLVVDNYQVKPYRGNSEQTSPTNLGFSLLSEVSAYKLGYIDKKEVQSKLTSKLKAIQSLRKYKGHLYNWYNVRTKQILSPNYISSVDSGNFVACLIVVKNFMLEQGLDGVDNVQNMIDNTDFDFLFDETNQQFYIGYNTVDKVYSGHYDMLASEARILYYIYSAMSHNTASYNSLKRPLSNLYGNTVLSWSGTAFEYLMPRIFINPPHYSLLYNTERNVFKYASRRKCHGVFGVSESGYYKYDDRLNYQYKAFGLNALAVRNTSDACVISPYSTFLGLVLDPQTALNNLYVLRREDMTGEYGYYEAVDYTAQKQIIYSYMAHHQGMILSSIANCLCADCISKYFMNDSVMSGARLLLAERNIESKGFDKERTDYEYQRRAEKYLLDIKSDCAILSNGKYSVFNNIYGQNVSIINGITLGRLCINGDNCGIYSYVKEQGSDAISSYCKALNDSSSDSYSHEFTAYKHVFCNDSAQIKAEVYVPHCMRGEVRKFTCINDSDSVSVKDFFGFMDIALCTPIDRESHPAFSDMFISSKLLDDNTVVYKRKSRDNGVDKYAGIKLIGIDNIVIETNKAHAVERDSYNIKWDRIRHEDSYGDIVTPIFSYSGEGVINPHNDHAYYMIMVYGDNIEEVEGIFASLNNSNDCEYLISSATLPSLSIINNRIESDKHFEFTNCLEDYIWQSKYDRHILENIKNIDYQCLTQSLNAPIDSRILLYRYDKSPTLIRKMLSSYALMSVIPIPAKLVIACKVGDTKFIKDDIKAQINELSVVLTDDARLISKLEKVALLEIDSLSMDKPQRKGSICYHTAKSSTVQSPDIVYRSGFGGYCSDGYVVDKQPLKPYSNVIGGKEGGMICTDRGVALSYIGNSRNDKVFSWSGEVYGGESSCNIYLEQGQSRLQLNRLNDGGYVKHGHGKSSYFSSGLGIKATVECYIINSGLGHVYEVSLENNTEQALNVDIVVNIKMSLGAYYTPQFVTENMENETIVFVNVVTGQRVYFALKDMAFIREKLDDSSYECRANINIIASQKIRLYYILSDRIDIVRQDIAIINREKRENLLYFNNINKIEIDTADIPLNYLFNSVLLYQTVSSRLNGKCGYYQVGGATGFRDQLQDCLAYMYSNPQYVRKHILSSAQRQFLEGDVLHWWHEPNVGVRTHISDDKLFLPYVTAEYVRITGDIGILEENVSYLEGEVLPDNVHDIYKSFADSNISETLRSHCIRAIDSALEYGEHGLLLIGSGDWNDALNAIGDTKNGESVWLSMFAYYTIDKFMPYLDANIRDSYKSALEKLRAGIARAYKNNRYARAVTKDGEWLGIAGSEVCEIDLICQSFAVISRACDMDNARQSLVSAEQLIDRDKQIVKLLSPPFDSRRYYGYISSYPEGVRENGGQYTHAVAWYIKALCAFDRDKAFEILDMVNPINLCNNSRYYDVEPYALSADVYTRGSGGWTWYTGSSSWFYKVILEDILGVELVYNKLTVRPHYYKQLGDIKLNINSFGMCITLKIIKSETDSVRVNGILNTEIDNFTVLLDDKITDYDIEVLYR